MHQGRMGEEIGLTSLSQLVLSRLVRVILILVLNFVHEFHLYAKRVSKLVDCGTLTANYTADEFTIDVKFSGLEIRKILKRG